eukprot:XP_019928625.1 PREDICTED: uncharacterized protein LOC105342541 isoform X2 [Crassostrea gigas]
MHCLLTKRKLFKQLKCFEEDFKWAYGRGDTALVIDKPTYHDKDLQKDREREKEKRYIGSPKNREMKIIDDNIIHGWEVEQEERNRDDDDKSPASPTREPASADGFHLAPLTGPHSHTESDGPQTFNEHGQGSPERNGNAVASDNRGEVELEEVRRDEDKSPASPTREPASADGFHLASFAGPHSFTESDGPWISNDYWEVFPQLDGNAFIRYNRGEVELEEVRRDEDKSPASPTREPASPDGFHLASLAGPHSHTESDGPQTFNEHGQGSPELDGNAVARYNRGEVELEEVRRDEDKSPASPTREPASPDGFHLAPLAGPHSHTGSDGPQTFNERGQGSPEFDGNAVACDNRGEVELEEVRRDEDKSPASPTREPASADGFHLASLAGPHSFTGSGGPQTFNDYWEAFPELDGNAVASDKRWELEQEEVRRDEDKSPASPTREPASGDEFHLTSLTGRHSHTESDGPQTFNDFWEAFPELEGNAVACDYGLFMQKKTCDDPQTFNDSWQAFPELNGPALARDNRGEVELEEVKRDEDKSPASPTREPASADGFHLASLAGPHSFTESDGPRISNDYWEAFPKLDGNAFIRYNRGEVELEEVRRDEDKSPASPTREPASADGFHLAPLTGPHSHTESDGPQTFNELGQASPELDGNAVASDNRGEVELEEVRRDEDKSPASPTREPASADGFHLAPLTGPHSHTESDGPHTFNEHGQASPELDGNAVATDSRLYISGSDSDCSDIFPMLNVDKVTEEEIISSSVQEVGFNRKGKHDYQKLHACLYCGKRDLKISRHLLTHHQDESDVAKLPAVSKNRNSTSQRRREKELDSLRNMGDFLYNVEQLQKKKGLPLIVARRPVGGKHTQSDYLPCKFCLRFYLKVELWRHCKTCPFMGEPLSNFYKDMDDIRGVEQFRKAE